MNETGRSREISPPRRCTDELGNRYELRWIVRCVPRSVAVSIVVRKTESIYRRYAIVDEAMQREAAARLDAWVPLREHH